MIAYVASKAGVAALTQSLAPELLAEGILINAVLPSTIDTPANRKSMPKADHDDVAQAGRRSPRRSRFTPRRQNALTTGTLVPVFGRA